MNNADVPSRDELNRAVMRHILGFIAIKVVIFVGLRMLAKKLNKMADAQT